MYTIQGDPEAEYKVSDAQDFHGATFGEEVDEEPNVPQWHEEIASKLPPPLNEDISIDDEKMIQTAPDASDKDENKDKEESEKQEKGAGTKDGESSRDKEGGTHQCAACGFEVDIGSSICTVCGNTLS